MRQVIITMAVSVTSTFSAYGYRMIPAYEKVMHRYFELKDRIGPLREQVAKLGFIVGGPTRGHETKEDYFLCFDYRLRLWEAI